MDPETIEHVFEPFFTTKEIGRGTGLGLATVYGIIRQNNGLIEVDSTPGEGTIIRIYLPRSRESVTAVAEEKKTPPARGSATILLVEDDERVLHLAETILTMYGYTVLAARSPGAAMDFARGHEGPVHLLVTDVVMPEMNGKLLKEKVAALRPAIKTLFISGYTADVIARHGVLASGIDFLQKPFSLNALVAKVGEVLSPE
jgi:CheY-like chemotaxis protein